MGLIEDIHAKGNTIILVTHEEDIAKHAHRIVRMRDGLIENDYANTNIQRVDRRAAAAHKQLEHNLTTNSANCNEASGDAERLWPIMSVWSMISITTWSCRTSITALRKFRSM